MSTSPGAALYSLIKSYEDQFPIPAPYVTVNVGAFNPTSGTFTGLTTWTETDPEPLEHEPNQRPVNPPPRFVGTSYIIRSINSRWIETVTTIPAPEVPLAPVKLQFSVTSATSAWSVTVNGVTASVPAGQASTSVNVWDTQAVDWVLQMGGRSHKDRLMIQRPAGLIGVGVGAFTIPALPICIVYAPPKDSLNKSTATYTQGQTVGSTTTTSFGTDTSTTNPSMQTAYAGAQGFADMLSTLGEALGATGAASANVVSAISSAFGKVTSSDTKEISEPTDDKITFMQTTTEGFGSIANAGGPGTGDVIVFAQNVLMAWVCTGNNLRLMPIGLKTAEIPAGALATNPGQFQLAKTDAQFLLSFDPFATGGPDADMDPSRFQYQMTLEYADGTIWTPTLTITRENSTTTTDKTVTMQTSEWDSGPLFQMIGLGGKTSTSVSVGNATGTDVSNTVTATATLVSGPGDVFVVNIYYDTIFGTFAFQQEEPAPAPRFTGTGTAAAQLVTLTSGALVFKTVTDANYKFTFRASNIPSGPATLKIGSHAPTQVNVPGMALEVS